MKIDINKDFEKAFPDDLWKGFTLKQIITFSVGLIMAPNDTRVKCPYFLSSFLHLSQQAGASAR